ncbi:hypothetical protein CYMTET_22307 [Cymbomonas tetramitiformis]|uniref:Uncharacterized protein n=1 Tax=Cymbomonas tetramitiformis TaxID=36881 RepID=A0AAE0G0V1_9CHLO|nr:hypothetical protein CYMTET_22307 [Cymbomonas tetramitiformis]
MMFITNEKRRTVQQLDWVGLLEVLATPCFQEGVPKDEQGEVVRINVELQCGILWGNDTGHMGNTAHPSSLHIRGSGRGCTPALGAPRAILRPTAPLPSGPYLPYCGPPHPCPRGPTCHTAAYRTPRPGLGPTTNHTLLFCPTVTRGTPLITIFHPSSCRFIRVGALLAVSSVGAATGSNGVMVVVARPRYRFTHWGGSGGIFSLVIGEVIKDLIKFLLQGLFDPDITCSEWFSFILRAGGGSFSTSVIA